MVYFFRSVYFSEIILNDLGGKNKKFVVNNAFFLHCFDIFYPQVNFFSHNFFLFAFGGMIFRENKPPILFKTLGCSKHNLLTKEFFYLDPKRFNCPGTSFIDCQPVREIYNLDIENRINQIFLDN